MANKYYDENGNSLFPDEYDKEDRSEDVLSQKIYKEKIDHKRPKPSDKFIDKGSHLTVEKRKYIIDLAGRLCDEDFGGRSLLCQQFAILVKHMLKKEGLNSTIYTGTVKYFNDSKEFVWTHFWIEVEDEIIDCNVDSMIDNSLVPAYLEPSNFWGPKNNTPNDRIFISKKEFSSNDEIILEQDDPETIEWKKKIDNEYNYFL